MLLTAIGLICIYAGYVLFCGLPAARRGRSRTRLLLLNILPGALLAAIGMSVITSQVKTIFEPHRIVRERQTPAVDSRERVPVRPGGLQPVKRPANT
jgi:hypothetical protein